MKQAGGFIIQLMPFTDDEVINKLEENLKKSNFCYQSVRGRTYTGKFIKIDLDGFDVEIMETVPTQFHCNCSKERVEKALISVGKKEIKEMIDDGKEIELNCHFCNKNYIFTVDELKSILKRCTRA